MALVAMTCVTSSSKAVAADNNRAIISPDLAPIEAHGPEVEADLVMGPSERRSLSRLHRWTAAEPGLEAFAFTFG